MKLTDLDKNNPALQALKANFEVEFQVDKLNKSSTAKMLNRVRGLISEAKSSSNFHKEQNSPSYFKLMFVEQALRQHYASLVRNINKPRIVVENVEVEKSQVILAAQDMVDSVQKMVEQVNDMLVKELPALTTSIENEIGANEGSAFNQATSQALTQLNQNLMQVKTQLQGALGGLTGQAGPGPDAFNMPPPEGAMQGGAEMDALPTELPAGEAPGEAPAEPPEELAGSVGRAKRESRERYSNRMVESSGRGSRMQKQIKR